ncbi:MAG: 50S ribosomal protein L11 methyltransferase [Gemmatimonadota bacterium]
MTAEWLVLSALVPLPGEEFLMVDALRRLGARAIEREGERVVAWLPPPADVAELLRDAGAAIRASTSMTDPALACHWQTHAQWVERWVRPVEPRRVTDRIVIAALEHAVALDGVALDNDIVIRLEAGIAFGTAEHATTRGCLLLLERLVRDGDCVADIGTGTGVLAIAAARLGARRVLAFEADSLSCDGARRNVAANAVADRVAVRERIVAAADLRRMPRCNVILANLELTAIRRLLPALRDALVPGGFLIAAGVTGGERAALLDDSADADLVLHARSDIDGWLTAAFTHGPPPA